MRRTSSLRRRPSAESDEPGRQLNLLISASRHKAFKKYAVEHDTSMSDLLSSWIDDHVEAPEEWGTTR